MVDNGKWSRSDVPHQDWTCVGIEDLEKPSATCQMCGKETIRFVHRMAHTDYPDTLDCCRKCAGQMEGDDATARRREWEAELRTQAYKRESRLFARWRKGAASDYALWDLRKQAERLCRDALKANDPARAKYEELWREVDAALTALIERDDAVLAEKAKRARSIEWWNGQRNWTASNSGEGRWFKFHHVRAWTFRLKSGRFSAGYTVGGDGPCWLPREQAQATEEEAAAMVEKAVGEDLMSSEFILAADDPVVIAARSPGATPAAKPDPNVSSRTP